MLAFPNAKINIGLHITEKRTDNYHNIESLLYPVYWKDVVEVLPYSSLSFESTGIFIPPDSKENLCLRAYQLLQKDFDLSPVQIHLHKAIPIGAGLGGGSADAAFTLKLLNQLFELHLTNSQLEDYARKLGSDCTFFIENIPQYATQKGDALEKIPLFLSNQYILLIYPHLHISTITAYSLIKPNATRKPLKEILLSEPLSNWKNTVLNDFEHSVFTQFPLLAEIKQQLYEAGAWYASMSGSGSAIFGLFNKIPDKVSISFSQSYQTWQGKLAF